MSDEKQYYLRRVVSAISRTVNTIFGGSSHLTIGGQIASNAILREPSAMVLEKVINMLSFPEKNHCRVALKWDMKKRKP